MKEKKKSPIKQYLACFYGFAVKIVKKPSNLQHIENIA